MAAQAAAESEEDTPLAAAPWVRRGVIKAPARAVEKALACYGGDVSRLLDVTRARLEFGGPCELAAGLEAVRAAGGVRAVRVKNSLRTDLEAWPTAGFRVRPGPPAPPAEFLGGRPAACARGFATFCSLSDQ